MKKEEFLYFNLNAGVSGDMLISSLIDLGVPIEEITNNLKLIDSKISIETKKVNRGPVECTSIKPVFPESLLNDRYSWKDLFSLIEPLKENLDLYQNAKSTLANTCEFVMLNLSSIPLPLQSKSSILLYNVKCFVFLYIL